MNNKAAANAILKISEALAELGYALGEVEQPSSLPLTGHGDGAPVGRAAGVDSPPAPVAHIPPSFDELPPEDDAPIQRLPARKPAESAFTKCPAHDKEWTDGKFGQYCTAPSEDPNWGNEKGYCRVTPRSAGAWLKQHPQGRAA